MAGVNWRSVWLAGASLLACGDSGSGDTPASTGSPTGDPGGDPSGDPSGTPTTTDGTEGTDGTGDPSGDPSGSPTSSPTGDPSGETTEPPPATCDPAGGSAEVAAPELRVVLKDRYEEAWLGSPAVADLDLDGTPEIVVPRGNALIAWHADGAIVFKYTAEGGRIWASPVVGDFVGGDELEVAFAARDKIYLLDAAGALLPGFPVTWVDELRTLAAADLDGDGALDLATAPADGADNGDVMNAWHGDGTPIVGFPPNWSGASGCDDKCYIAGCYDQNLALGDLDGDGRADLVVPHDNAYVSIHSGAGEAFDAADIYPVTKTPGVRYLHDLASAMQGYADDEETALQAHFTNTPPAIADIDGDGQREVLLLASVQNAAQSDREKGVAVWVVGRDALRHPAFVTPVHFPDYLSGLWDYGDNIVAITNQLAVADLRADSAGLEMVFPGFDGAVHAVGAAGEKLWSYTYTTDATVAAAGVAIGDLSADGLPEVVLNTYSTGADRGELIVLSAQGELLHALPLPRRGAMPVPTLADADGDGVVDIVVSLKDAEDKVESVQVYRVPGSSTNCLPWPTGRGNLLRSGLVP
jgi:hypothetical protein